MNQPLVRSLLEGEYQVFYGPDNLDHARPHPEGISQINQIYNPGVEEGILKSILIDPKSSIVLSKDGDTYTAVLISNDVVVEEFPYNNRDEAEDKWLELVTSRSVL